MSPIEEARAALTQRDDFEAGRALAALTWPGWAHLRAALAEVDRLTTERDAYRADLARVSAECDLPPVLGPAPGEIRRWRLAALDCAATIDREVADRLSGLRRENTRLTAEIDRLRAACADLPPEPETSPMAAFLAVLATDNHPDNADGGGDCDGLR